MRKSFGKATVTPSLSDPLVRQNTHPHAVAEFMERLAALVPRPRLHLIRFHGVLAPNAKLRSKIIPAPAEPATETSSEGSHAPGAPAHMSWARLLKRVFDIDIEHCPNAAAA